jgi:hypothetical protein
MGNWPQRWSEGGRAGAVDAIALARRTVVGVGTNPWIGRCTTTHPATRGVRMRSAARYSPGSRYGGELNFYTVGDPRPWAAGSGRSVLPPGKILQGDF